MDGQVDMDNAVKNARGVENLMSASAKFTAFNFLWCESLNLPLLCYATITATINNYWSGKCLIGRLVFLNLFASRKDFFDVISDLGRTLSSLHF